MCFRILSFVYKACIVAASAFINALCKPSDLSQVKLFGRIIFYFKRIHFTFNQFLRYQIACFILLLGKSCSRRRAGEGVGASWNSSGDLIMVEVKELLESSQTACLFHSFRVLALLCVGLLS